MEGRLGRVGLGLWTLLVVLFLWVPLLIILVYAFNTSNIQSWPIPGFTTRWFSVAWNDQEARSALLLSLKAALCATGVALVLGTMAAVGVARFRFFGREAVSFLLVLPLALPGDDHGHGALVLLHLLGRAVLALDDRDRARDLLRRRSSTTMSIARLRRTSPSLIEASMDLGADGWQTFRFVTFPQCSQRH